MGELSTIYPPRTVLNGAAIFGGEVIARLSTLLMAVVVARFFDPVALGEYGYAVACTSVLVIIPDMGLHLYTVRELSTDPARLGEVFWNVHWLKLFLSGGVVLFALLFGPWGIPDNACRILFFLLVARLLFQTFSQASMTVFKAFERMHFVALQQFANTLVVIAWVGIALATHASLPLVASGLVAGQVVETLLGWRVVRTYFSPGRVGRWNLRAAKMVLAACLPIGITAVFQALNLRMDILVLGHYVSKRALGEFQAAAWFPVGIFLVASLVMTVLFPKLSRLGRGPSSEETEYIKSLVKNGVLWTGAVALGLWYAAPFVLRTVFGQDLGQAGDDLRFLVPVLPLLFLNTVLFYVFVAARRRAACLAALLVGAVAGVGLSVWLTSQFGPAGCAMADTAREFIISTTYLMFLLRRDRGRVVGTAFLRVLGGASLLTAAGAFGFSHLQHGEQWFAIWIALLLAGTATFFGLPSLKDWRLLLDDSL